MSQPSAPEASSPEPFDGLVVFDAPETTTVVARQANLPMTDMAPFYDSTFTALFPALAAEGVAPTGAAFGLYTSVPSETVDLEAGVPVDRAPENLPDGLLVSALPAGKVAATTYVGPYDGLGTAWGTFMEQVAAAGHTAAIPFWEVYVTEPSPDSDPTTLRTDLYTLLEP